MEENSQDDELQRIETMRKEDLLHELEYYKAVAKRAVLFTKLPMNEALQACQKKEIERLEYENAQLRQYVAAMETELEQNRACNGTSPSSLDTTIGKLSYLQMRLMALFPRPNVELSAQEGTPLMKIDGLVDWITGYVESLRLGASAEQPLDTTQLRSAIDEMSAIALRLVSDE